MKLDHEIEINARTATAGDIRLHVDCSCGIDLAGTSMFGAGPLPLDAIQTMVQRHHDQVLR